MTCVIAMNAPVDSFVTWRNHTFVDHVVNFVIADIIIHTTKIIRGVLWENMDFRTKPVSKWV